ncbi:GRF1-interacting factor 1-like [Trifolium medium]|uniref:GRF1-interacting factor 1-like n=1 Tax=Trifolium medium TaxID=97028 RepID=A0A392PA63_9FABA|nr:GRF1-interacting factor 1-like [Trifolium medium]
MMQQGGHYMQAQQAQQMSQQQLMAARSSLLYAQQLQQQQALQSQLDIGNTADGRGGSSSGHSGDGGETLYLKSSGDGN